jgi:hypothetical protein
MLLDGIRYAADMAAIALDRLWTKLTHIDSTIDEVTSADIAEAALDAWSIIDAAHRLSDLIGNLPGLPNKPWRRIFANRMKDAAEFRDEWQHQLTEVERVVGERGQMWGSLAWAQHTGPKPTGWWFLAVIGSDLKGSQWFHAGPVNSIPRVDSRRMRIIHCNREIYLDRIVRDIFEAIGNLEQDISGGNLALRGECVNQPRSKDWVISTVIQVLMSARPPDAHAPEVPIT